jgi:hypothetical protein
MCCCARRTSVRERGMQYARWYHCSQHPVALLLALLAFGRHAPRCSGARTHCVGSGLLRLGGRRRAATAAAGPGRLAGGEWQAAAASLPSVGQRPLARGRVASGRESPPPGGGKPAREERRCTPGAAAQRILQLPLSGSDSQKGSGRGPPSQGHSGWQGCDSVRLTGGRGSLPVSGNRSTRAVQVTVPWSRSWSRSPPPPARASLRQ